MNMSRRAANVTRADVARVLRAAQMAGPNLCVEIEGGFIRMILGNEPSLVAMPRQGGRGRARPSFAMKDIRSWKPVAEAGPL